MKVGKLTFEQKNLLLGQKVQDSWYFNPVQDFDGNWVISIEEINNNQNPNFDWLNEIEQIDWNPPIYESGLNLE